MILVRRTTLVLSVFLLQCATSVFAGAAGTVAPFAAAIPDGPFFIALKNDSTTFYAFTRRNAYLLDVKGSVVPTFKSGLPSGSVIDAAARAIDGTLYVGGRFSVAGQPATLLKMRRDGTIDASFAPPLTVNSPSPGVDSGISTIAPDESDGCYIGGSFNRANGAPADGLGHVGANGVFVQMPRPASKIPSTPIYLATSGDALIVVETKTIYRAETAGPIIFPAPAGGWDSIYCAAFDSTFGLAVAGLVSNSDGIRCYLYSPDGELRPGFDRVQFVFGPAALMWDDGGRLLASSAQVVLAPADSHPDLYGVKRLLPDGSLDLRWSLLVGLNGLQPAMLRIQDRIIVGGAFNKAGPIECGNGMAALRAEAAPSSPQNQSTRAMVTPTSPQIIMGFTVTGEFTTDVLIRASSASLQQFGVRQTVSAVRFTLFQGRQVIVDVPAGGGAPGAPYFEPAVVTRAATQAGAFPLIAHGLNEAEQVVTLAPGAYSIVISGPPGETGEVLGEIFFF